MHRIKDLVLCIYIGNSNRRNVGGMQDAVRSPVRAVVGKRVPLGHLHHQGPPTTVHGRIQLAPDLLDRFSGRNEVQSSLIAINASESVAARRRFLCCPASVGWHRRRRRCWWSSRWCRAAGIALLWARTHHPLGISLAFSERRPVCAGTMCVRAAAARRLAHWSWCLWRWSWWRWGRRSVAGFFDDPRERTASVRCCAGSEQNTGCVPVTRLATLQAARRHRLL